MNKAKIDEMKKQAEVANIAYETEKTRLIELGYKSKDRYEMLKQLKLAVDSAHAAYAAFAKGQIHKELDKIIAADLPIRQEAARARSQWKRAKYEAASA